MRNSSADIVQYTICKKLLDSLHAHHIPYALLRDDLTPGAAIRDLDLLVSAAHLRAFHHLAAAQGFILIKDGRFNPGKYVYLRLEGDSSVLLDVHEKFIYRGLEFLDAAAALARRQKKGGFYYLAPEEFLLSLLFHNVLAKGCIQEKHQQTLQALLAAPLDRTVLAVQLRKFGLARVFARLEQDFAHLCDRPEHVDVCAARAVRALRRRPGNLLRVCRVRWRKISVQLAGPSRGVLIALLGPDGAGKSTTLQAIESRLRALGLGSQRVYLGPWGGSTLKLRELFAIFRPTPYRDDYKAFYKGKLARQPGPLRGWKRVKFAFRSGLYYLLLMLEMRTRWQRQVVPRLRQGKIVLADRYIYDILTGYKNRPMDYHVGIRQRLCRLLPRPDIGVLLDAAPEQIFARKPQFAPDRLAQARAAYHEVAQTYGFLLLDTSESVAATMETFEREILPILLEKLAAKKQPPGRLSARNNPPEDRLASFPAQPEVETEQAG